MCAISRSGHISFFDFQDGHGLVPAHQHSFGGGWVADTARVEDSVYVGPSARVYEHASICGNARICGSSEISGYAEVRDNVCINDHARVRGRALIEGNMVLEKDCLVGAGTHLKGNIKIGDHATFLQATRCLGCPLLADGYGAMAENHCANCLSARIKRRNEASTYKVDHSGQHPALAEKSFLVSAFETGNAARAP